VIAGRYGFPAHAFDAVAEFVLAQALNILRRLYKAERCLREGEFRKNTINNAMSTAM